MHVRYSSGVYLNFLFINKSQLNFSATSSSAGATTSSQKKHIGLMGLVVMGYFWTSGGACVGRVIILNHFSTKQEKIIF